MGMHYSDCVRWCCAMGATVLFSGKEVTVFWDGPEAARLKAEAPTFVEAVEQAAKRAGRFAVVDQLKEDGGDVQ